MNNSVSALLSYDSPFSVKETIDRIEKILREKNVTVFARINHGEAAKQAGLNMQDEELIVFGNPKVGTDLMLENPEIGIELPLKILAWQSNAGTKVGYQHLDTLLTQYKIEKNKAVVANMSVLLKNLIENALK